MTNYTEVIMFGLAIAAVVFLLAVLIKGYSVNCFNSKCTATLSVLVIWFSYGIPGLFPITVLAILMIAGITGAGLNKHVDCVY
jgi:hypothetical protein